MHPEDRRSKRTKTALLCALSELLREKTLREITINELVSLADLHRSTFYTHYSDIYDFYRQEESHFLSVYEENVKENPSHDYIGVFQSILTYLDENRVAAGMFFRENAEPSFRRRLTDFIMEQYLRISAYEDSVSTIPQQWNSLAAYHAGGIIHLLSKWVRSGYAISREEMLQILIQLDHSIAALRRSYLSYLL